MNLQCQTKSNSALFNQKKAEKIVFNKKMQSTNGLHDRRRAATLGLAIFPLKQVNVVSASQSVPTLWRRAKFEGKKCAYFKDNRAREHFKFTDGLSPHQPLQHCSTVARSQVNLQMT